LLAAGALCTAVHGISATDAVGLAITLAASRAALAGGWVTLGHSVFLIFWVLMGGYRVKDGASPKRMQVFYNFLYFQ